MFQRTTAVVLVGHGTDINLVASILSGRGYAARGGNDARRRRRIVRVESLDHALTAVQRLRCNEIVVGDASDAWIPGTTPSARDAWGRDVRILPAQAMLERLLGRISISTNQRWIGIPRVPTAADRAKRALDIGAAAVLLLLLAVPALLVWLALVTCGMEQPVRSTRCAGQCNVPFLLRAFAAPGDESSGIATSMRWRFGVRLRRLLRVSRFAQLPMLMSVVAGDMSLVGPRPDPVAVRAGLVDRLPLYAERLACRPGLVSLAVVRFRYSDTPRDLRLALEYDLYYIKYRSLLLDSRIMARAMLLLAHDWLNTVRLLGEYVAKAWTCVVAPLHGSYVVRAAHVASVAMPPVGAAAADLQPTLLAGAGHAGRLLARELRGNAKWGLWPVAFVDDDPAKIGRRIEGIPVLGNTGVIPAVVHRERIETVVIAMPSAPEEVRARISEGVKSTSAHLMAMPSIGDILSGRSATALTKVSVDDFLGRPMVSTDTTITARYLAGKRVLVTGAAGSIGQEVARQAALLGPAMVYGLDINESDLFDLEQELRMAPGAARFVPLVGSVTNSRRLADLFEIAKPEVVFHAAAYKHVPMMESHPAEAVITNVVGTYETAMAAARAGVQRFVLVSTDKAVRPSSVMGATKRLAELVIRDVARTTGLSTCAVRFGNVLGSRGSVIPLFRRQIAAGGPVTITHPAMKRYFMTISEAAGLIIEAGAFGDEGVIYMLDMGEEVAIKDLAERMIRAQGLRVGRDIEIAYSGLRPGEKLREELSLAFESAMPTVHPKVRILREDADAPDRRLLASTAVHRLSELAVHGSAEQIRDELMARVREVDGVAYHPPALWFEPLTQPSLPDVVASQPA